MSGFDEISGGISRGKYKSIYDSDYKKAIRKAARDKLLLKSIISKNEKLGKDKVSQLDYLDRQAIENW